MTIEQCRHGINIAERDCLDCYEEYAYHQRNHVWGNMAQADRESLLKRHSHYCPYCEKEAIALEASLPYRKKVARAIGRWGRRNEEFLALLFVGGIIIVLLAAMIGLVGLIMSTYGPSPDWHSPAMEDLVVPQSDRPLAQPPLVLDGHRFEINDGGIIYEREP